MSFSSFTLEHTNSPNVVNPHMTGHGDSQSRRTRLRQGFTQNPKHRQTRGAHSAKHICIQQPVTVPTDSRAQNKKAKDNNRKAAFRGPCFVAFGIFILHSWPVGVVVGYWGHMYFARRTTACLSVFGVLGEALPKPDAMALGILMAGYMRISHVEMVVCLKANDGKDLGNPWQTMCRLITLIWFLDSKANDREDMQVCRCSIENV